MTSVRLALGLESRRRYGAANLLRDLEGIWAANLIGLYTGYDLVSNQEEGVTGWSGQKGPLGANTTANRFGLDLTGQRPALLAPDTGDKSISFALAADVLIVVASAPALPLNGYQTLGTLGNDVGEEILTGNTGTSSWFLGGAQYRDGVLSSVISSGIHVYEGIKSGAASTVFRIGGGTAAGRVWMAPIYVVAALAAPQTPGERAASLPFIQRYMNT